MGVEVENYGRFNEIRIHGKEGALVASKKDYRLEWHSGDSKKPETIQLKPLPTFKREMEHFLNCIKENREPRTSGIEERNSLAVVQAGYQSMRGDRAVEVEMRKT
jgi:predicted dehydrogenase